MPEQNSHVPIDVPIVQAHTEKALGFISDALGVRVTITNEDRLRGAILEACIWLRDGAPARALETLEQSLNLPRP
jgi:hypothetical protein